MKNGWVKRGSCTYHYVNDLLHNDTGPAVVSGLRAEYWYKYGKRHREDGPAVINKFGKAWCYEDKFIGSSLYGFTQEKFNSWLKLKAFI